MIREFLKWFLNKISLTIIIAFLVFIIPFIIFIQTNTTLAIIWFLISELIIPAFIAWYVVDWSKK